ncbi:MutS-related protein [Salinisphaera sp. RV14]|uniref:MutS-related protein n=1 Tax=Salinisphaera sp. RV14 TaxID=3454140 RepID=UPI003F86059E
MKVFLMHPEQDFDPDAPRPALADELVQDLELDTLFDAMAAGDDFLRPVVEAGLLNSVMDAEVIRYRQQVLLDCGQCRSVIERLYELAVDAIDEERKQFHFSIDRASVLLHRAVETMAMFHDRLRQLRQIAEQRAQAFESPAFVRFFKMLRDELSDDYLAEIAAHLKELKFEHGILLSARLGAGNKGVGFVLRELPERRRGRLRRLVYRQPETYAFEIHPRDQAGIRALEELRNRGLDVAANALGQASDHVLAFFKQLRTELAFYRGALNLLDALQDHGMPTCYPEPRTDDTPQRVAQGLYDPSLCLTANRAVVGNDIAADGYDLVFVTGANQGGKSTFLRSLGLAQLLMQAGLFVPAERFAANICSGVFTHYKREEDASMASGKFEEELLRMDEIVTHIQPGSLILFNESFAATNEREGAEIAAEIVDVLLEKQMKVVFVTHFYELALAFSESERTDVLFLEAERSEDGSRTHRIRPGRPSRTAYGRDIYARIFADHDAKMSEREVSREPEEAGASLIDSD